MMEYLLDVNGLQGFKISFPYSPDAVKQLKKACPGFAWDKAKRIWYSEGPETLLDLERAGLHVSAMPAAIARWKEFRTNLDQILAVKIQTTDGVYGFQETGIQVLALQRRGLLADDMGLGKSRQALLAAEQLDAKNILVVAPKSLVYNWEAEVDKWYPGRQVAVVPDDKKERASFWGSSREGIVVVNYEKVFLPDWPHDRIWDVLIIDEIQRAKNTQTKTSKALRAIAKHAGAVFALSGTPLEMRVEELYGIMSIIRPAVLGGFSRFRDDHLVTDFYGRVVGSRNHLLLKERVGPWMTRRTKAEVLPQLPPKVYNTIWVELSADERQEYDRIAQDFLSWLAVNEREATEANALTQLLRLQQFTSSPSLLIEPINGDALWHGSKFEELKDLIREWSGRVVVFTRFEQMAQRLSEWLGNSKLVPIGDGGYWPEISCHSQAFISGNVPAKDRLERIDWFNAGHLGKVLISTDAGAYGYNITGADLVVQYDLLWNPSRMWQREDRLHRIGQESVVNVVTLVARGTVDQGMLRVLEKREELFHDIIDGAEEAALLRLGTTALKRIISGG